MHSHIFHTLHHFYFSEKQQFVKFNGFRSSWNKIKCGVPQGSILGPLFFLIYINDICNASTISEFILFTDDTNIFFSGNKLASLVNVINSEMKNLSECFFANRLSINVHKSNYIVFTPRQMRQTLDFSLAIEINNHKLKRVKETTFLGVILNEKLSWKSHISYIVRKISKSVGIIYK